MKPATNPSTVLVIFLVFFVLLSLGLGVWGYFGYKAADQARKAAAEAQQKEKAAKDGADWYRLQGLWYKYASLNKLGPEEETQFVDLYGKLPSINETSKPVFEAQMKEDMKNLKWDDKTKKFARGYFTDWKDLEDKLKKQTDANKDLTTQLGTEKNRQNTRDKEYVKYKEDLKSKVDKANEDTLAAAKKYNDAADKTVTDTTQELAKYDKAMHTLQKQLSDKEKEYAKVLKEKNDEIEKLLVKKAALEAQTARVAKADLSRYDTPKGKIVRIDHTGKMPYINLGRADGVKEQLTFSVYGVDRGGKVQKEPKASLEVVKVIAPHLSQARVTYLRDASGEPLLDGDLVYNPAWNPHKKTYVAIAGIVDFTGEDSATVTQQMRALREFINNLERQNIVVDAYLDLQTLKVKGKIKLTTDYFIRADGPSYGSGATLNTKDETVDFKRRTNNAMAQLEEEAVKKGVAIVPLHKFTLLTGYRVPKISRPTDEGDYVRPSTGVPTTPPDKAKEEKKDDRLGEEKKEGKKEGKDD
jgi:hypothetical protein